MTAQARVWRELYPDVDSKFGSDHEHIKAWVFKVYGWYTEAGIQ